MKTRSVRIFSRVNLNRLAQVKIEVGFSLKRKGEQAENKDFMLLDEIEVVYSP